MRIWKVGCSYGDGHPKKEVLNHFRQNQIVSAGSRGKTPSPAVRRIRKEARCGDLVFVYGGGNIWGVGKIVSLKWCRDSYWANNGSGHKVKWCFFSDESPLNVDENTELYGILSKKQEAFFSLDSNRAVEEFYETLERGRVQLPRKLEKVKKLAIAKRRKYGGGGESPEHLEVKKWVAKNPKRFGVYKLRKIYEEEYIFETNDCPDVVFEHADEKFTIVEAETTDMLQGAYQVVKYRALLCAERGWKLQDPRVKTFVIASNPVNQKNAKLKMMSRKYNIRLLKYGKKARKVRLVQFIV